MGSHSQSSSLSLPGRAPRQALTHPCLGLEKQTWSHVHALCTTPSCSSGPLTFRTGQAARARGSLLGVPERSRNALTAFVSRYPLVGLKAIGSPGCPAPAVRVIPAQDRICWEPGEARSGRKCRRVKGAAQSAAWDQDGGASFQLCHAVSCLPETKAAMAAIGEGGRGRRAPVPTLVAPGLPTASGPLSAWKEGCTSPVSQGQLASSSETVPF